MKILIFSFFNPYPPKDGGCVRIWNVAKSLSSLGVDVKLVTLGEPEGERLCEGIPIHQIGLPRTYKIIALAFNFMNSKLGIHKSWALSSWINLTYFERRMATFMAYHSEDVDLIQCEFLWFHRIPFYVAQKKALPIVLTKHDIEAQMIGTILGSRDPFTNLVLQKIFEAELKAVHDANVVVCPSYINARELVRNGIPKEKIVIIPHGANAVINRKRLYTHTRQSVLFIGSRHPPNVEAAKIICTEIAPKLPDLEFLIIGTVNEAIKDFNIPRNVTFTGFVSREVLEDYYHMASVGILPLTSGSGMKVKTTEMLTAGIPIITTRMGAQGFRLRNMEDAVIEDDPLQFPPLIRKVLNDPVLWNKLSINGLKRVHFSWTDVAQEYIRTYKMLMMKN